MLLYYFCFLGRPIIPLEPIEPCNPSPCGPNSQCRVIGTTAVCSCLPNYTGRAPHCRPECTTNSECSGNLACINERCKDPCPGSCGSYTTCIVTNHRPICRCYDQYTGDPFSACSPIPSKNRSTNFRECNCSSHSILSISILNKINTHDKTVKLPITSLNLKLLNWYDFTIY